MAQWLKQCWAEHLHAKAKRMIARAIRLRERADALSRKALAIEAMLRAAQMAEDVQ